MWPTARYLNRDYAQVREVCNRFEKAWGLTVTGKGTRRGAP